MSQSQQVAQVMHGTIFYIKHFALHDGPGIRTTIFLKGCPLNCAWCHNPEGRNQQPEERTCAHDPAASELVGSEITVDGLLEIILRQRVFFSESGGGVTFSGGEPTMQPEFLLGLLKACTAEGIHTAVDTCGQADPDVFRAIAEATDLFLFDLKVVDSREHELATGVPNELILANLELLAELNKPTVVRFPLIPGYTDRSRNIDEVVELVRRLENVKQVQVLPYHKLAASKLIRLGLTPRIPEDAQLAAGILAEVSARFGRAGLAVSLGGHA